MAAISQAARRTLDRDRPYGHIFPATGAAAYEQDGLVFDSQGFEAVTLAAAARPAPEPDPNDDRDEFARMPWIQLRKLAIETGIPDAVNKKRAALEAELRARRDGTAEAEAGADEEHTEAEAA